jgi:nucleoside-diphosphate kinase
MCIFKIVDARGDSGIMQQRYLEQTLVLIKPDALKNSLTGYVLSLLSEFHTGLRFAGTKIVHVSRMLAEEHYIEHQGKSFFPHLIEYIKGISHYPSEPYKQRVIAIVYQGTDAVKKVRDIAGPTNPHSARDTRPGCVRALGTIVDIKDSDGKIVDQRIDNLIHASSSDSEAEREVKLWFKPSDIPPSMHSFATALSNEHYYYKNGKLITNHEEGSICLLAPGNYAWESDLIALDQIAKGIPASVSLSAIAAKYLVNELREES